MGRLTYDNKDGSWGIHGHDTEYRRKASRITKRQQALIDGVEYALDNALEVTQEDMDEYYRLTGRLDRRSI